MAIVSPKELYAHACEHDYALGAFNVFSLESMLAVMEAAKAQHSAAIIQVSMGARKYVRHLKPFVEMLKGFGAEYDVPFFIQHDHCSSVEACKEAVDAGVQALMFDGSHLSYEENISKTREVCDYAHAHGVWVEAELGCLPGFEDMVFAESAVYTDPKLVRDFIARSGCDALAIAAGTSHGGVQADDYLPLDIQLIERIASEVPGYPLVLHGAASLPPALIDACNKTGMKVEYLRNCSEESIRNAVKAGIRKANMDVDNFLCFTTVARMQMESKPAVYDPRKYLAPAMEAFKAEVEHKMKNVVLSSDQY